jgi:hypothetical protein
MLAVCNYLLAVKANQQIVRSYRDLSRPDSSQDLVDALGGFRVSEG